MTTLLSSAYRDMDLLKHRSSEDVATFVSYLNESFVSSMSWIMWFTAIMTAIAAYAGYKMIILDEKAKASEGVAAAGGH